MKIQKERFVASFKISNGLMMQHGIGFEHVVETLKAKFKEEYDEPIAVSLDRDMVELDHIVNLIGGPKTSKKTLNEAIELAKSVLYEITTNPKKKKPKGPFHFVGPEHFAEQTVLDVNGAPPHKIHFAGGAYTMLSLRCPCCGTFFKTTMKRILEKDIYNGFKELSRCHGIGCGRAIVVKSLNVSTGFDLKEEYNVELVFVKVKDSSFKEVAMSTAPNLCDEPIQPVSFETAGDLFGAIFKKKCD